MTQPGYSFEQHDSALRFDFDSISNQKIIHKRVLYSPTDIPNLYNLALGDVLPNGALDDTVRSNNNDRDKVIATVVQTLSLFLNYYPESYVLFQGSTDGRTRLYRAVISRELAMARELFDIYGVLDTRNFELFQPDNQYIAFLITSKK